MSLRAKHTIEKRHRRKGDKMRMILVSFAGTLIIFLLGVTVDVLKHMASEQIQTNQTIKYVIENQSKNETRINSNILELKSLDHRVVQVETDIGYLKKNNSNFNRKLNTD